MTEEFLTVPRLADITTRPVLAKAIEYAEPPAAKNPVFGILVMENGTLLVVHDASPATGKNLADIFSPEGEYLGRFTLNNHAMVAFSAGGLIPKMTFKNGFAYTAETDEEGDNRVLRYTVERVPVK